MGRKTYFWTTLKLLIILIRRFWNCIRVGWIAGKLFKFLFLVLRLWGFFLFSLPESQVPSKFPVQLFLQLFFLSRLSGQSFLCAVFLHDRPIYRFWASKSDNRRFRSTYNFFIVGFRCSDEMFGRASLSSCPLFPSFLLIRTYVHSHIQTVAAAAIQSDGRTNRLWQFTQLEEDCLVWDILLLKRRRRKWDGRHFA